MSYPVRPTFDSVTVGAAALPNDPMPEGLPPTPVEPASGEGYPVLPTFDSITATGTGGTGGGGGGTEPVPVDPTPVTPPPAASGLVAIKPPMLVVPEDILEIYASSEQSGHPPRLLLRPSNPAQWWTPATAGTTHRITVRLKPGRAIDCLSLMLTNAGSAATIRVFGAATRATAEAGGTFNTVAAPFWASTAPQSGARGTHSLVRLAAPQTYEWWTIQITGAPAVFSASHLVVGKMRQSARNYNAGAAEEPDDFSDVSYTPDGAMAERPGFIMRRADFEMVWISETEYETKFRSLWWEVGNSKPVLVLPNSAPSPYLHDRMLYGRITRSRGIHETSKYFGRSFEIASLI